MARSLAMQYAERDAFCPWVFSCKRFFCMCVLKCGIQRESDMHGYDEVLHGILKSQKCKVTYIEGKKFSAYMYIFSDNKKQYPGSCLSFNVVYTLVHLHTYKMSMQSQCAPLFHLLSWKISLHNFPPLQQASIIGRFRARARAKNMQRDNLQQQTRQKRPISALNWLSLVSILIYEPFRAVLTHLASMQ